MRGTSAGVLVCMLFLAACSGSDLDDTTPSEVTPAAVAEDPEVSVTEEEATALVEAWVADAGIAAANGPTALARFVTVSRHPDVDADGCVPPFADRLVDTADALEGAAVVETDEDTFRVSGAGVEIEVALLGSAVRHLEGCGGDDGLLLAAQQELEERAAERAKRAERPEEGAVTEAAVQAQPAPSAATDTNPTADRAPATSSPPSAGPRPDQPARPGQPDEPAEEPPPAPPEDETALPGTLQEDQYAVFATDPAGDVRHFPGTIAFPRDASHVQWVDILAVGATNHADRWSLGVELAAIRADTRVEFVVCLDADCTMDPDDDKYVYRIRSTGGSGWSTVVRNGEMWDGYPPRLLEAQMGCEGLMVHTDPATPWLLELEVGVDEGCLGFPPPDRIWVGVRASTDAGRSGTYSDTSQLLGPVVRD